MKKSIIPTLAKKEFLGFINSPLAYVITVPFLLISTFVYFRVALVGGEASLRPFFELLPWFLLILTPALSMKLLTEEQKQGTWELLFAHPISELQIVFAKFLGAFAFFVCVLLATLGLPLTLILFSRPDLGIILAQYLGALFVGACFLSIGLATSAFVKNAIASFLLAASIGFVLIIIGLDFVTLTLPWPLNLIFSEVAVLPHMQSIARGVLDIRDILYFATLTALFLSLATSRLLQLKTEEDKSKKRKIKAVLALVIILGIGLNVLMHAHPLRLDLTKSRLFTLSYGTKQTLKNLPDKVTVNLFVSQNLPGQMQLTLKQVQDLLKDYQRFGKNLEIKILYPEKNQEALKKAQEAGIEEVTFSKIGVSKFESQTGFLGLEVVYGDKSETIAFIEDTTNLEYQLTRFIRKLTSGKQRKIGLYKNTFEQTSVLEEALGTEHKVEYLDLGDEEKLKELDSLLVIDDGGQESTAAGIIKNYLNEGGKVLALLDGVNIEPQVLTATPSASKIPEFLKDYGIKVNSDLVYDLQLNETLTFGAGNVRYLAPYPFWLKALPNEKSDFAGLSGIKAVTLGWPSSIEVEKKESISYQKLLLTSKAAGRQEENFTIMPQAMEVLAGPLNKNLTLSVMVEKENAKLVVVADSQMASDQFVQNNPENLAFLVNTIDWLTLDPDIGLIPRKTAGRAVFEFTSPAQAAIVQYTNILVPLAVVIVFAFFWLGRRKRLAKRKYSATSGNIWQD